MLTACAARQCNRAISVFFLAAVGSAVYTKSELPPTPIPPASINYWYRIRFQNTEAVPSAYSEGQMVTVPVP